MMLNQTEPFQYKRLNAFLRNAYENFVMYYYREYYRYIKYCNTVEKEWVSLREALTKNYIKNLEKKVAHKFKLIDKQKIVDKYTSAMLSFNIPLDEQKDVMDCVYEKFQNKELVYSCLDTPLCIDTLYYYLIME